MMDENEREARRHGKIFQIYSTRAVRGVFTKVPVRVNQQGLFSAQIGAMWYEAPTFKELTPKIDAALVEETKVTWQDYIAVYDAGSDVDFRHSYGRHDLLGFTLQAKWYLVRVSTPVTQDKKGSQVRLSKSLLWDPDKQELEEEDNYVDNVEVDEVDNMIPFTKERYLRLLELQKAAEHVGERLKEILTGDANKVAGFLDAGIPLLLPSSVTGRKEDNAVREDPGDHKAGRRRRR